MRVPMKQKMDTRWRAPWRNVHEVKTQPQSLERQLHRPARKIVVVAQYHRHRTSELFEFHQGLGITDVAQMPDFVRFAQESGQIRRITIVGVSKDGDTHVESGLDGRRIRYPSAKSNHDPLLESWLALRPPPQAYARENEPAANENL